MLRRGFLTGSVAWATMIPVAAFAASRTDGSSLGYAFALGVYAIGRAICHQLPARSFHAWGVPLPVCARCTGIYVGAAVTAIASAFIRPRAGGPVGAVAARRLLAVALAPTAATLAYEWTTGMMPGHWVRALAGFPLGAAVAWLVGMIN